MRMTAKQTLTISLVPIVATTRPSTTTKSRVKHSRDRRSPSRGWFSSARLDALRNWSRRISETGFHSGIFWQQLFGVLDVEIYKVLPIEDEADVDEFPAGCALQASQDQQCVKDAMSSGNLLSLNGLNVAWQRFFAPQILSRSAFL